ncbi:MAG: type II toxin-antitoxin system RelE/ParE family toxin [Saprospiraceae bacterium]|nr:type II toxin-antitoxin system RelE/ParE family toxin [Saprospiraceae bacterium]
MVKKQYYVVVSMLAFQRLKEISDYLKTNVSAETARKVRNELLNTAKELEFHPEKHPLLPGTVDKDHPYRYAKKWSYKIIFRIIEPKDEVWVLDFFHTKQNPEKLKDLV